MSVNSGKWASNINMQKFVYIRKLVKCLNILYFLDNPCNINIIEIQVVSWPKSPKLFTTLTFQEHLVLHQP